MLHYNITVRGRVQGVFYRGTTKQVANQLGIKGFVRNEPDESVYIEAEAEEELLQQFISWCKMGPDRAIVDSVTVTPAEAVNFTSFEIRK
jgi:acylphosphatase